MHPDIVVCELLAVEAVTGKDKLKKCTVSDGEKEFTVVSNAPNVLPEKVGKRIVVARVGAEVSGMEEPIKKTNVGGVVSEGMLCDERMLWAVWKSNLRRVRTRHLLDGVAMSVPRRSTEPARPRHRREMT
jgi:predicted RNA-binding protein with EMAP domain